jgi:tRNA (guanine-N7-)-methyltransferase
MFWNYYFQAKIMPQKRVRPHVNPLSITHEHKFEGFGNDKPICIDIGAYKGEFTAQLLEKFPEKNFLVFEIRQPIYLKLCDIFAKNDNVQVFDGDAGRSFRSILEPCMNQGASIEEVFINFPDPWFKARHKKRRFINANFLQNVETWISPQTKFIFQTDQKTLFDETLELIEENGAFEIETFDASPYGVRTHWENIKIESGDEIYRMKFCKRSS